MDEYATPSWSATASGEDRVPRSRFGRHRLTLLLSAVIVVLAGIGSWALYAMHVNEVRAHSWERRTQLLQRDEAQLQSLLTARTRLLNQQIDQLDALAKKLKRSQVALGQSQGDVSSLEVRQRALANEKAQLQDQQAALDQVASNYISCKRDLIQLLSDVAKGYDTSYDYSVANSDCSNADSSLQGYLSAWPNG